MTGVGRHLMALLVVGAAGCDVVFGVDPGADGPVAGEADARTDADPADADPADPDGDGVVETLDNCPGVANPVGADGLQPDEDRDQRGDACDLCPHIPALDAFDADSDGVGDGCDPVPGQPTSMWYRFEGFSAPPMVECPSDSGNGNPDLGWACIRSLDGLMPAFGGGSLLLEATAPSRLALSTKQGLGWLQHLQVVMQVQAVSAATTGFAYLEVQTDENDDGVAGGVFRCGLRSDDNQIFTDQTSRSEMGVVQAAGGDLLIEQGLRVTIDSVGGALRCTVDGAEVGIPATTIGRSIAVVVDGWRVDVPYLVALQEVP
ncbi:MAG: thrombospondin type 3 repeat-containing protein [Kofleriaceae bacterium]|nr:thrombospondin type 3 repeat-containing protein [Kofleriaceae bacterium]